MVGKTEFYLLKGVILEDPFGIESILHLFTENKAPYIAILNGVRVFEEDYKAKEVWPKTISERLMRAIG